MNFVKTCSKLFVSMGLITAILFSGQSIGHAEDQYTNDLVPKMTSNNSPSGVVRSSSIWSVINHQPFNVFNDSDEDYGWSSAQSTLYGWVSYEFSAPTKIQKYTIKPRVKNIDSLLELPKDWTFEGWNGTDWIILDTRSNIKNWVMGQKNEFTFDNNTEYLAYRINVTKNNGSSKFVTIGEIEMMAKISESPEPEPNPEPKPEPTPEPTGDKALLVIKMISGLEKEFELSASEVQDFIDWYNGRADGRGKEAFMFDKDFNKGPFTSRNDYVAFSKIQSFEVMEYTK
ncbi:discoidin domain-containing protein [Brevibacillus brevis]|uniref:discoidin domain-containing protein n=1 Tax=Brevibacillus brevis TaxID=1393 RepID=UPI00257057FC|nr:discoidin domain-containing protein [Lysinibacillus sp. SDF0063]